MPRCAARHLRVVAPSACAVKSASWRWGRAGSDDDRSPKRKKDDEKDERATAADDDTDGFPASLVRRLPRC